MHEKPPPRHRPDEDMIGPNMLMAKHTHQLADLARYLRASGRPADIAEAKELERFIWLRADYNGDYQDLLWSEQSLSVFSARDDVWNYLQKSNKYAERQRVFYFNTLLDEGSPRFDPGRAVSELSKSLSYTEKLRAARLLIEGKLIPADMEQAETILVSAANGSEEARTLLLDMLTPRLNSPDTEVQSKAVDRLTSASYATGQSAQRSRILLTPIITRQLASPDAELRVKAAATMTRYIVAPESRTPTQPLFNWMDKAFTSANAQEMRAAWKKFNNTDDG